MAWAQVPVKKIVHAILDNYRRPAVTSSAVHSCQAMM